MKLTFETIYDQTKALSTLDTRTMKFSRLETFRDTTLRNAPSSYRPWPGDTKASRVRELGLKGELVGHTVAGEVPDSRIERAEDSQVNVNLGVVSSIHSRP